MITEMQNQLKGTLSDFFDFLCSMRATSAINESICDMVSRLHQDSLSVDAQKTFHVMLSLMDDGNTCISLNPSKLLKKWMEKWDGVVLQAIESAGQNYSESDFPGKEDFRRIIESGCAEIAQKAKPPIVCTNEEGEQVLYFQKYYDAKRIIESCFKDKSDGIFVDGEDLSSEEFDDCKKEMESWLKPDGAISDLKKAQVEAIARGQHQNLIITGGPGTGKTTVVFFLLWNLLKKETNKRNWNIYFAAPSGKAAYRLRESLVECFDNIKDVDVGSDDYEILQKLKKDGLVSYTLHRLLKFDAGKNEFSYNSKNRLPEKSIFVIDEASMIDLSMFASFMSALPEKNYRLFVLGDKDQLPSVDAGAVLGEMLDVKRKCIVRLTESNRFNPNSKIGRLARFIQTHDDSEMKENGEKVQFVEWEKDDVEIGKTEDEVRYVKLLEKDQSNRHNEEAALKEILGIWKNNFYSDLCEKARIIRPELTQENNPEEWSKEKENRKALWKIVEKARILSAERLGLRGVVNLNQMMMAELGFGNSIYSDGCLVMLNKNQNYYGLFNGDSGVVVNASVSPMLMLLRGNEFVFYPLSYFPEESLEPSFAITIHKSQGSGYPNIMMFLPKRKGHPLLTRQILYTGVTRTKRMSLTIIATPETFEAACIKGTQRDTGIHIAG